MKLRTAKKIMKQSSEDGNGKSTYTGGQLHRALQRYERCKSHKLANAFWHTAMRRLGVEGRAEVLAGCGAPGKAFNLLMREEW